MIRITIISFFICQLLSLVPTDADAQDILTIRGVVLSKKDLAGIAYVHVNFENSSIGTVTNENGAFLMKFPNDRIGDVLILSSIGYKTQRFPVSTLMTEKPLEVILSLADFTLDQAIVEGDELAAHRLVQKAISKIEDNYDERPVILNQFYREYLKVHAPRYVSFL